MYENEGASYLLFDLYSIHCWLKSDKNKWGLSFEHMGAGIFSHYRNIFNVKVLNSISLKTPNLIMSHNHRHSSILFISQLAS